MYDAVQNILNESIEMDDIEKTLYANVQLKKIANVFAKYYDKPDPELHACLTEWSSKITMAMADGDCGEDMPDILADIHHVLDTFPEELRGPSTKRAKTEA